MNRELKWTAFCNIINVFTGCFDQFNASLMNKSHNLFLKTQRWWDDWQAPLHQDHHTDVLLYHIWIWPCFLPWSLSCGECVMDSSSNALWFLHHHHHHHHHHSNSLSFSRLNVFSHCSPNELVQLCDKISDNNQTVSWCSVKCFSV